VNQEVLENFGHFGGKYLQDKLLPTLKEKIVLPNQSNHIITPERKNNVHIFLNFASFGNRYMLIPCPDLIVQFKAAH
jgi:tryptophan synthase beta subunit